MSYECASFCCSTSDLCHVTNLLTMLIASFVSAYVVANVCFRQQSLSWCGVQNSYCKFHQSLPHVRRWPPADLVIRSSSSVLHRDVLQGGVTSRTARVEWCILRRAPSLTRPPKICWPRSRARFTRPMPRLATLDPLNNAWFHGPEN